MLFILKGVKIIQKKMKIIHSAHADERIPDFNIRLSNQDTLGRFSPAWICA
jgi:hypothetical protein